VKVQNTMFGFSTVNFEWLKGNAMEQMKWSAKCIILSRKDKLTARELHWKMGAETEWQNPNADWGWSWRCRMPLMRVATPLMETNKPKAGELPCQMNVKMELDTPSEGYK